MIDSFRNLKLNIRQNLTLIIFGIFASSSASAAELAIAKLQPFRNVQEQSYEIPNGRYTTKVDVRLTNLNPYVGRWYILELNYSGSKNYQFHLDVPEASKIKLHLDKEFATGIILEIDEKNANCSLWGPNIYKSSVQIAATKKVAFSEVCKNYVYVVNYTDTHLTLIETGARFFRDNVWGGDKITSIVKTTVMQDQFHVTSKVVPNKDSKPPMFRGGPNSALVDKSFRNHLIQPLELGIEVDEAQDGMFIGQWYKASGIEDIYVSVMNGEHVDKLFLNTHKDRVNNLDPLEKQSENYLIAFDLSQFELGFTLGVEHPAVGWSSRPPYSVRKRGSPGPDGIGSTLPLKGSGMVHPKFVDKVVATFTGGFKRLHGAFRYGEYALKNQGSHFGFIESGVILSSLQPGLATLYILRDGAIGMKTWQETDEPLQKQILHARQNLVPLLSKEGDKVVPHELVSKPREGGWSGSVEGNRRALRAGACLQKQGDKTFLIYGYFSSVTPSAMVRIFQSYGCDYAMHLDMNALEHTYLAVYKNTEKSLTIQHLNTGMHVLDKYGGKILSRYLNRADNRDFFYMMRKQGGNCNADSSGTCVSH